VISSKQQLLRIDSEDTFPISAELNEDMFSKISELVHNKIDAIIIEDYDKGLLNKKNIESIIAVAKANNIPVAADPKRENFHYYKGLSLFKPNLKELKEGLNRAFSFETENEQFSDAVNELRIAIPHTISLITLSEHGVFICNDNESAHITAHKREIADVSGAGDTVIAVATLCLLANASIKDIAQISNIAGGMVCEKPGVVSISLDELKDEVRELL
jgi:rfaE bifunctional protein kinase chain/domain